MLIGPADHQPMPSSFHWPSDNALSISARFVEYRCPADPVPGIAPSRYTGTPVPSDGANQPIPSDFQAPDFTFTAASYTLEV